jgi:hypothetical protein
MKIKVNWIHGHANLFLLMTADFKPLSGQLRVVVVRNFSMGCPAVFEHCKKATLSTFIDSECYFVPYSVTAVSEASWNYVLILLSSPS